MLDFVFFHSTDFVGTREDARACRFHVWLYWRGRIVICLCDVLFFATLAD